jgi:hypothetical protein
VGCPHPASASMVRSATRVKNCRIGKPRRSAIACTRQLSAVKQMCAIRQYTDRSI